jgi:hypothetical protein
VAKLRTYVHVTDDKGQPHAFGPDDNVPEWAQALITNPKAWAEAPSVKRLTDPEPAPKAPAKRAAPRRKASTGGTVQSD